MRMTIGHQGSRAVLGGKAKVFCIHDREKRLVTTERQVAELGLAIGVIYDARLHKLQRCACCDNLFFDPSDEPRYCSVCKKVPVHAQGGPLALPRGVVDE
jgi:hypothetical protein